MHKPYTVVFDLADTNTVLNAAEEILKHLGHVDILINNAGISYRGTILDTGVDVDKKVMETNYFGPVAFTKGTYDLTPLSLLCVQAWLACFFHLGLPAPTSLPLQLQQLLPRFPPLYLTTLISTMLGFFF